MKFSAEEIYIPFEKITDYLLVRKEKNDKSSFLFLLGYTKENWKALLNDIREVALHNDLILERKSDFGDLYSIKGELKNKKIITIWLKEVDTKICRFITLYPDYE